MRTCCTGPGGYVNTVDIFNARSGTWSTAALSVARGNCEATSLPNYGLALFAHGSGGQYVLMSVFAVGGVWGEGECVSRSNVACAAANFGLGGTSFNTVDIFNARNGTWSTAALSLSQGSAFTTLPNYGLAIFAGGPSGGHYVLISVIAIRLLMADMLRRFKCLC